MTIHLRPVVASRNDMRTLYELLKQRKAWQSISHKAMPSYDDHIEFVKSEPYSAWYMIMDNRGVNGIIDPVGAIYLTRNKEIGISIFKAYQGKGYGRAAVEELMNLHKGPFLANINPLNVPSRKFFEELGFTLLQVTYSHG